MILYAYKKRNKYGQLMYVFSSENYNEAIKRNNYLIQIKELRLKQLNLLKNKESINNEIVKINIEKEKKVKFLSEKTAEKQLIEKDRKKQELVFRQFKKKEEELL